jgi:hypothetical protein
MREHSAGAILKNSLRMNFSLRSFAFATVALSMACIGACTPLQPPPVKRPSTITVYPPKLPPGYAGPGEFTLSDDGEIRLIPSRTVTD